MRWRRSYLVLGLAWAAFLVGAFLLARAGSSAAAPFSNILFILLVVTGLVLPWQASLAFLVVTVGLVHLAGPDSIPIHLTLGGDPLSAGTSLFLVECVLLGLGTSAQSASTAARKAGREEGLRLAAQEESKHLRLVLRSTSHEIGNVLTGLNFVAHQVEGHGHEEEAARLERLSNRIRRLVGDLSDAAGAIEGTLQVRARKCDLARIARDLAKEFKEQADYERLTLTVEAPETLPVQADEARVEQVVANLLQNAFRYTPSGGNVRVRVLRDGEAALVTVQDTGLGLTREQLNGLFQPFVRFHVQTAQGSGLGLWIAQNIMRAHGGTVQADSPGPQQGATFTLQFPNAATAA